MKGMEPVAYCLANTCNKSLVMVIKLMSEQNDKQGRGTEGLNINPSVPFFGLQKAGLLNRQSY